MPVDFTTAPVEDTVAKVNNEVAVGSDLKFQRKWWRFEKLIWWFFVAVIVADLLGCFGRGPLAKATVDASDGSIKVRYERIERFSTPSTMMVTFSPSVVHNGTVQLWVDQSLVKPLGNQRTVPQPLYSADSDKGITYTFPASSHPGSIEFALQPTSPGVYPTSLRVVGHPLVQLKVYVMP